MHHGRISRNTARALLKLKERIDDANIPSSKLDETINVATWNIREFGRKRRRNMALHLIAEIIGQFDLVAVTELRDNLSDLKRVLTFLGPYWDVVYSDFNRDRAGNRERIGYIYDRRAVTFTGLAAEADPVRKKRTVVLDGVKIKEYVPIVTWWRSPFMASFRSGDFDFVAVTAHIRWDSSGGEASRKRELQQLARWIGTRSKERYVADKDIVVMGDFNIPAVDDELYRAVTSTGLRVPDSLRGPVETNLARNKRYDQILHFPRITKCFTDHGGVLDFFAGNHRPLMPGIRLSKHEFTYQLSDHLPLWVQLNVDTDAERLDNILQR